MGNKRGTAAKKIGMTQTLTAVEQQQSGNKTNIPVYERKACSSKERIFFSVTMLQYMKSAPDIFWRYLSTSAQTLYHIILGDDTINDDNMKVRAFSRFLLSIFSRNTCVVVAQLAYVETCYDSDERHPR